MIRTKFVRLIDGPAFAPERVIFAKGSINVLDEMRVIGVLMVIGVVSQPDSHGDQLKFLQQFEMFFQKSLPEIGFAQVQIVGETFETKRGQIR